MKLPILIMLIIATIIGCGPSHQKGYNDKVDQVKFPPPVAVLEKDKVSDVVVENNNAGVKNQPNNAAPNEPTDAVTDTTKKIIREGDIKFKTEDLGKTRSAVLSSIKKLGGYTSEEKEFTDEDNGTRNFTINARVPANKFDQFLNQVTETAIQIDSKNITTTDVTTQYIDVTTRLRNQKALEARYLDLLKNATRMADVLEVEGKLNEIRTEIESNQGQLNYLMKQVAYSSLEITFYIKRPDFSGSESENRFARSLKDGWQIMQQLFFGIITLWPIVIAAIVAFFVIKRWRRKRVTAK